MPFGEYNTFIMPFATMSWGEQSLAANWDLRETGLSNINADRQMFYSG